MENIIRAVLVMYAIIMMLGSTQAQNFNVMSYGAVGDGISDDTKAFNDAWAATCGATSNPTLQIPQGKTYLLKPITFQGPCKSSAIHVQVLGNIVAPKDRSAWAGAPVATMWLEFSNVNGLTVDGTGQIDGQGSAWWDSCTGSCKRPSMLTFNSCNDLKLNGLTHLNSQRNHLSIEGCNTVTFSNLKITAPETSPNTDGIDIANSKNVQILDSNIATGDDCIAINTGSSFVNITGVTCGPGHGISVGSLGEGSAVEEVHVKHCTFINTQSGCRIKTKQGGSGYARAISFENITLQASGYPIFIDQFYSIKTALDEFSPLQQGGVQVSQVSYTGVQGTSSWPDAITFNCSSISCTGITLNHINITSSKGGATSAVCSNAHGTYTDSNPKVDCLLS